MQCPNCASENRNNACYCIRCGQKLFLDDSALVERHYTLLPNIARSNFGDVPIVQVTPQISEELIIHDNPPTTPHHSPPQPISHPEQLTQGIVRILNDEKEVGTGFVVSESGLIATCSHVIQNERFQDAYLPRPEKVGVLFYETGDKLDASVEADYWLPWNAGDLAVLRVKGIMPSSTRPLPLGSSAGTNGHDICTFGFPDLDEIEGIGGDGKVVRSLSNSQGSLIQIRSNEITDGFSGAPIWDKLRRRVIGIVSSITKPDRRFRLVETAFAISAESLQELCPVLQISDICPYRGLAAFGETDAEFFCGRQHIIDNILNRLRQDPRFLTILGPSGSGKSSIIQAGVIPQLRKGKILGSDRWRVIVVRPADNPFDELVKQGVIDEKQNLTESVQTWLHQHPEQERLLFVFDQFEELFITCSETLCQSFVQQITDLLQSSLPISVILVMRDDFYSRMTQHEILVKWLEQSRGPLHIPQVLKLDELTDIVQRPAEAIGLRFEEGLVEVIVRDTTEASLETEDGGQVGRSTVLPLLEFALTELWKRRQEGMLTHESYMRIGAVVGALTQWADRAFFDLKSEEQRQLARRIFTDLIYLGDEHQGILDGRRRRTLTSLCRNDDEQQGVQHVVQQLVESRLLVTDRDLQTGDEIVEIIHDVLLRTWGRLQHWIEEDREFLEWRQKLEEKVQEWLETDACYPAKRDREKLLGKHDLLVAKEWQEKRNADLSSLEQGFIIASEQQRRRTVRRQRLFFIILSILLVITIASTSTALRFALNRSPTVDPTLVTNLTDHGQGSLRQAITTAPAGSTIHFRAGLHGTIFLTSSDLIFEHNLTVQGPGSGTLAISGGGLGYGVRVTSGVIARISNLSFTNTTKDCQGLFVCQGFIVNEEGTLDLTNVIVANISMSNTTGSPIFNAGGTLALINSVVSSNTVLQGGYGGGIYSEGGSLTIRNSNISHNTCDCSYGGGVGVVGTTTTIENSSIWDNTLDLDTVVATPTSVIEASGGGGIFVSTGPHNQFALINSTIAANRVIGAGRIITNSGSILGIGGGILIEGVNSADMQSSLTFCTIYGNIATNGKDIAITSNLVPSNPNDIPPVTISNSIVVSNINQPDPDVEGGFQSGGHNLFPDQAGIIFKTSSDKIVSVPALANLFADPKDSIAPINNSGLTSTYALGPNSPAVDQIPRKFCNVATDQRGRPRPDDDEQMCDIGAYELSG